MILWGCFDACEEMIVIFVDGFVEICWSVKENLKGEKLENWIYKKFVAVLGLL